MIAVTDISFCQSHRQMSSTSADTIVVLGLGYVGSRFALCARALLPGWRIVGTIRADEAKGEYVERLRSCGVEVQGSVDPQGKEYSPIELYKLLETATHIVATAPPLKTGENVGKDPFLPCIRHMAAQGHMEKLRWAAYLSTTSVYGNRDGAWVDETTAPKPSLKRGKGRLACEQQWLSSGLPAHVFRLPGIYGPLRGPQ